MEMLEILKELNAKLESEKVLLKDLDQKVKDYTAALKEAEEAMCFRKNNVEVLEMMIEAAREGHFGQTEVKEPVTVAAEPVKEQEKQVDKKEVKVKKTVKQLTWKHKDAFVIQLNQYDNVLDRWRTQAACARGLHWDQSSVSRFMKLSRDQQIARKGFALVWEY